MVFRIFSVLHSSPQPVLGQFSLPHKEILHPVAIHFSFLHNPPSLGNHLLTFCFYILLPILGILYKWSHTIGGLPWLVSFAEHHGFKVCPCGSYVSMLLLFMAE